jgi:hypothetical protein
MCAKKEQGEYQAGIINNHTCKRESSMKVFVYNFLDYPIIVKEVIMNPMKLKSSALFRSYLHFKRKDKCQKIFITNGYLTILKTIILTKSIS